MQRYSRPLIFLVLLVLALVGWKWTHPTLSDEDQIKVALDGLAAQASNKSASGVTSFLSKDFQIDGLKRGDLKKQLTLGLLQYRVVEMKTSRVEVQVSGDTATTTGYYYLNLKSEYTSPGDKYNAPFTLKWKREDGTWKISNADGNKLPTGLSGGG